MDWWHFLFNSVVALVAWLLVVLGWAAVNDLTAQRERAKANESKLAELRRALSDIEDLAISHHSSAYDELRARRIVRRIKGVGMECSHLERCNVIDSRWRSANSGIRRAVTSTNFEPSGFAPVSLTDDLLMDIEEAFSNFHRFLMRSLEEKVSHDEPLRKTLVKILSRI